MRIDEELMEIWLNEVCDRNVTWHPSKLRLAVVVPVIEM